MKFTTSDTSSHNSQLEHYQNDLLQTPKTYDPKYLHEWVTPPVVPENSGMPGEMG